MKKKISVLWVCLLALCLVACTLEQTPAENRDASETVSSVSASEEQVSQQATSAAISEREETEEISTMGQDYFYITVGQTTFPATFAENSGAQSLKELLSDGPLTIEMDDYGGFEKVGSLGQRLPASDVQTTTRAGDIVLYQGNQIVVFYGSNSWSYTRLGTVANLDGWNDALGNGDITIQFSLNQPQE